MVRVSDLRLNGREFDLRPPHYRSVRIGMDDRLRVDIPSRYVTSHPGQLSHLPSVGREMSTGQSAVMRCGWRVKSGWLSAHPISEQTYTCGWRVKLCDPSLTRARGEFLRKGAIIYKCPVFNFYLRSRSTEVQRRQTDRADSWRQLRSVVAPRRCRGRTRRRVSRERWCCRCP